MDLKTLFNTDIGDLVRKSRAHFSAFEHVRSLTHSDERFLGSLGFYRKNKKGIQTLATSLGLDFNSVTPCRHGYEDTILFSKEHGFTIRITRSDLDADFYRRMHGIMVSPIGWGHLSKGLSFYIYPGEILLENHSHFDKMKQPGYFRIGDVLDKKAFEKKGFWEWDVGSRNVGVIESESCTLPFFIDTDCLRTVMATADDNKQRFELYLKQGLNPGQAYARVTVENSVGTDYEWTALRHQDLRNAFFEAWPKAHQGEKNVDPEKMQKFLEMCKSKVTKPRYVQKHFWSQYTNEHGVKVWRKHVSPAEREQLYLSWKKPTQVMQTGKSELST